MAERTHYEVLGVPPEATQDQIRRAYRAQARKKHPDTGGTKAGDRAFAELAAAYAVLSDSGKRRAYDLSLRPRPQVAEPGSRAGHFSWTNIAAPLEPDPGDPGRRGKRRGAGATEGAKTELDEIYDTFYRPREERRNAARPKRPSRTG